MCIYAQYYACQQLNLREYSQRCSAATAALMHRYLCTCMDMPAPAHHVATCWPAAGLSTSCCLCCGQVVDTVVGPKNGAREALRGSCTATTCQPPANNMCRKCERGIRTPGKYLCNPSKVMSIFWLANCFLPAASHCLWRMPKGCA